MKTQSTDFGIFVGLLNKINGTKYSVKNAAKNQDIVNSFQTTTRELLTLPESISSTKSRSYTITELETGSQCRALVFRYLKEVGPSSRQEIAIDTQLRLSSVCGRVNELIIDGKLIVIGEIIDPRSNKSVELVAIASEYV